MKKEKLFAKFLKETFFTSEETFSAVKVNHLVEKLQKGQEQSVPETESQKALESFLKQQGMEPVAEGPQEPKKNRKGSGRKYLFQTAGVGAILCLAALWVSSGGFQNKFKEEATEEANKSEQLEEKDSVSVPESAVQKQESKPVEAASVLVPLEDLEDLSQEEIQEELLGTEREGILNQWGEPQDTLPKEADGTAGDIYWVPNSTKVIIVYYTYTEEQKVCEIKLEYRN